MALSERRLQVIYSKPIIKGIRRVLSRMQTTAVNLGIRRGILRSVFGRKKTGLRKIVRPDKVRSDGARFVTGISAKGLAGLQETGGRTKQWSKTVKVTPRRGAPFTRRGRHPGGPVREFPFLVRAVRQHEPQMRAEVTAAGIEATRAAVNAVALEMVRGIPGARLVL